jgi:hypothetical protein
MQARLELDHCSAALGPEDRLRLTELMLERVLQPQPLDHAFLGLHQA